MQFNCPPAAANALLGFTVACACTVYGGTLGGNNRSSIDSIRYVD